ncbi:uncharacterized protein LOC100215136 isoform X4 [Hydra vulgaris]|uniref:Uncharacterized protein LOC100215136 isoform X4 n=1 Tax=Hydra vulgaris TaxID=6087 RepID=A0ABM4BRN5_HYDVU
MGLKRYSNIKVKEGREVVFLESIGYPSGSFKDKVRSYCNAFLNSHGGILYFGCGSDGCIYGGNITRKTEDDYRLAFDSVVRNFVPFVPVDKYRLSFLFIENEKDLAIIEIKVSIGDVGEIYEDGLCNVYIIDCGSLVGPLYPQELRELILLKYKESVEGAEEVKKFFTPNIIQAREKAKLTSQKRKLEPIAEESRAKVPPINIVKINRGLSKQFIDLTQSSKSILSDKQHSSQIVTNDSNKTELIVSPVSISPIITINQPNKSDVSMVSIHSMNLSVALVTTQSMKVSVLPVTSQPMRPLMSQSTIQPMRSSVTMPTIQSMKSSVSLLSNPISQFVNSKIVGRRYFK